MSRSLKPVSVATKAALQARFKQGSETTSRFGVGQVFRARVLNCTEACKAAESSSGSLYFAPFSLTPANVLLELSKVGATHALVILSEKRAIEFSNAASCQTAVLPFTSMAFHSFADKMRQHATSPLRLLHFQAAQFHELIKHATDRPTWTFPPESYEEPNLEPDETGKSVEACSTSSSSVAADALICTPSSFYQDVFTAAESGDLEQLACLLVSHDVPLGSARHTASGGTPLHFLATSSATPLSGPAPTLVALKCQSEDAPEDGALETAAAPSALMEPQSTRLESIVCALLAGGVDINATARNGSTALHWAAGAGNLALVRLLLEHGADPYAQSYTWRCAVERGKTRRSAHATSCIASTPPCRREVYGRGSGQTPLHWAAESNHADVVDFLAAAAPLLPATVDERGRTPRDLALREGASAAGAVLLAAETTPLVAVEVCGRGEFGCPKSVVIRC